MAHYAVIENDEVINIIVCDDLKTAKMATGLECFLLEDGHNVKINDKLTKAKIAEIKKKKEEAEAKAEADRVAAIEAENERLRQAEADRLAAEEASKPKPKTGVFVRVEPN